MALTVGQLLINDSLPEDLRDTNRTLDKKALKKLLQTVADKYPDQYRDIVHKLNQIGADAAYSSGASFSLNDIKSSVTKKRLVAEVNQKIGKIIRSNLPDEQKDQKIIETLASYMDEMRQGTHAEGLAEGNNFSLAIQSGARGNPSQLSSLRGADLMVLDHKDRPIPIPLVHNFSEGVSPSEYFAGAFGTRKGIVGTKLATAKAGYLGKLLANANSRLLVTDEEPLENTGFPVDTDDPDNEGAVLARDYGNYTAGTVITPAVMRHLKKSGIDDILVHSPISAGGRGVPRLAAGYRERGGFSPVGDNIGFASAQALSEPISQSMLSTKHSAGVVGAAKDTSVSGFEAISQMVQIPKTFQSAATVSSTDGTVSRIEDAPQGGKYVWVGDKQHYVSPNVDVSVKVGQRVEAGDAVSAGIPNPAEVVQYKGIGDGRRYFVNQFRNTLRDNGIPVNRRNVELLARGLINHVRVVEPDGVEGALPDDIISYDELAQRYKPRFGAIDSTPPLAKGKYLEKPVLHYSIGTRVTPSVVAAMKKHKIGNVTVHNDPPPFEPHMIRAMETTLHDPDWFRRLSGFYIGKGFLDAAQRGSTSEVSGQNWAHALASGKDFGKKLDTEAKY